jgi:hypothetical protein
MKKTSDSSRSSATSQAAASGGRRGAALSASQLTSANEVLKLNGGPELPYGATVEQFGALCIDVGRRGDAATSSPASAVSPATSQLDELHTAANKAGAVLAALNKAAAEADAAAERLRLFATQCDIPNPCAEPGAPLTYAAILQKVTELDASAQELPLHIGAGIRAAERSLYDEHHRAVAYIKAADIESAYDAIERAFREAKLPRPSLMMLLHKRPTSQPDEYAFIIGMLYASPAERAEMYINKWKLKDVAERIFVEEYLNAAELLERRRLRPKWLELRSSGKKLAWRRAVLVMRVGDGPDGKGGRWVEVADDS